MRERNQPGETPAELLEQKHSKAPKNNKRENFNLPPITIETLDRLSGEMALSKTMVVRIAVARLKELRERMPKEGGQIQIQDLDGNSVGKPFQFIDQA